MSYPLATLLHIAAGLVTLALWWGAFSVRKGGPRHRRFGRLFLVSWAPTLASVGGVFFLGSQPFSAPEVVQFVYLSLCVATVGGTAFLAIRLKRDLAAFRGTLFRAAALAVFGLGALVLAAGLAGGGVVPVAFSTIGLIWGGAMIRFAWMRAPAHPNWPLIWHLNGMLFLFNAVHGTLLAVLWRALVDPAAGEWLNAATHFGTMAVCLALRLWFGARYEAPLRLSAEARAAAA